MPDSYYCWLIELVGDGQIELLYQRLLWRLYSTPFFYELEFDRNRAVDGLQLRKKYYTHYLHRSDIPQNLMDDNCCSVLEMLIALSQRAEDNLIYDPNYDDNAFHWFWTILTNLGLDLYDDNYYFEEDVDRILSNFMHHNYGPDGSNGGAFPCPGVCQDLRNVDLWWQLGAYFQKNYPIQIW